MMAATRKEELVRLAAMGDEESFADLVRATSRTLYAAARAILRNDQDAQDCVQEAILKGWRKLDTLRDRSVFSTWMTRIAITTAINMSRRRRETLPLLMEVPAEDGARDERLDIRRAIDALDRRTRVITVLYYFEDMKIAQIAAATGMGEGAVKSRLFRAREKLRDILEGYDDEE